MMKRAPQLFWRFKIPDRRPEAPRRGGAGRVRARGCVSRPLSRNPEGGACGWGRWGLGGPCAQSYLGNARWLRQVKSSVRPLRTFPVISLEATSGLDSVLLRCPVVGERLEQWQGASLGAQAGAFGAGCPRPAEASLWVFLDCYT